MLFCLIHGAWHDETCWAPLADVLRSQGHEVVTPRLPIDDPRKQLADYAQTVIEQLPADLPPTVLVGHSMSSDVAAIVASQVPTRLLVYLCPRMAIFNRHDEEPKMYRPQITDFGDLEDELGRYYWRSEDAVSVMYASLNKELAKRLAARLRPQANPRRDPPPIRSAPKVPSIFIYSTEDEFFEPSWSRWAAKSLVGLEPIEISGGHFPMLEDPRGLAKVLCEA